MIVVKFIEKQVMIIRKLNIGLRLSIGFAVIIAFSIIIGFIALKNISNSTVQIQNMYKHPLAVSRAVGDINANVVAIHRSMKDVALSQNEEELLLAEHLVDEYEKVVYENFEIVLSQFLGDLNDVKNAHKSFSDWKPIREEVIYLWHLEQREEAIAITKGKGAVHVEKVLTDVKIMMDFANSKAESYYQETYNTERKAYNSMLVLLVVGLLLSIIIVVVITRSLVEPVKRLNIIANKIEAGDLSVRHQIKSNDEVTKLARSFNKMADSIEVRNNVLSGLAAISAEMHGKHKLREFAGSLLVKIKELTKTEMVTFYVLERDINKYTPLQSVGAHSDLLESFDGDNPPGDFGNVLRSKQIYHLKNISNDTVFLYKSVVGDIVPKEVITIPILENNVVVALISCASIQSFSEQSLDIIQQSQPIISASFITLLANRKTRKYSQQLSTINQELEVQSEELKQQADELRQSGDNLHEQNMELEMQRRQVEEANRLKSEFLSNMSHELRTPLNSINALSNVLIMQSSGKLNEDEANYLEIIERNGKRLLSLINDILDLSKVEAGKMDFQIKPFSLNSALRMMTESVESLALEKDIELNLNLSEEIEVNSDESRLTQVVTNVLGNAIKFTEKGSVDISTKRLNNSVQIVIKDTGIGIHEDVLPLIFQEFRQADGTTSRAYEGTGLGLAIANKMIEVLEGSIEVESELGIGSVFTVTLPLSHSNEGSAAPVLLNEVIEKGDHDKTILIVDDDDELVLELSKKMKSEGFHVLTAFSGETAIDLAIKHNPFVITLDIVMPEMDGWEVLQKLQQNSATKDIPVIIISKSDDLATSVALGAVGYIQKPVNKELILREIQKINKPATSIAVVDDSEIDRMQIGRILEKEKFKSTLFVNGEQCLNYLKTKLPDVLILDLMMPGMDGFQVLKEIRSNINTRYLPVIVVTAKDLNVNEKELLSKQAASLISKGTIENNIVDEIFHLISKLDGKRTEVSRPLNNGQKNILIIEDNSSAIIQIQKVLENEGLTVNHASSGKEALEFVKNSIPDGIILDLMMPEMDGFEVLEKIRSSALTRNIPVLILTAKNLSKADLAKLSSNNVQQLIQKGDVNINELVSRVNLMLGKVNSNNNASEIVMKKQSTGKPKIVLIEDNQDNRTTVRAIVGDNYEIVEAQDGESGVKKVISEKPDLVLLDISLPGKDGFAVIDEIRNNQQTNNIPVIALTAKAMKGDKQKIIEAGCNEYVSKPIEPKELIKKISLYI